MIGGLRKRTGVTSVISTSFAHLAPANYIPIGTPSSFFYHLTKRFIVGIIIAAFLIGRREKEKTRIVRHKLLYQYQGISTKTRRKIEEPSFSSNFP